MCWNVIGLMSGTSLDGIDAALVSITNKNDQYKINLISFLTIPYPKEVKEKLLELCDPMRSKTADISSMNMLLGELFADAVKKLVTKAGYHLNEIDLISSHGQTVYHQPDPVNIANYPIRSTLQIGDISVIAERTGVTTVGDFRTRDMAAGGQGAPLVPFADYLLFKNKDYGRIVVNIGGITNITLLPPNCNKADVVAYDTGPGNMIIDLFTYWATSGEQNFDRDGLLALNGKVNYEWLEHIVKHPYFKRKPPKSTGREMFGEEFAKKLWEEAQSRGIPTLDRISTVTMLTVRSLADEIKKNKESHLIKEVIISGGGWYNKTLISWLEKELSGEVQIIGSGSFGIPEDAKESIVFALLGYLCMNKKSNNLPTATGASHSVIMGKISW